MNRLLPLLAAGVAMLGVSCAPPAEPKPTWAEVQQLCNTTAGLIHAGKYP